MREGRLYINDRMVRREPTGDAELVDGRLMRRYIETLPNGVRHPVLEIPDPKPIDNTPVFQVPADHNLMLGDNPDNSPDSRRLKQAGSEPAAPLNGHVQTNCLPLGDGRLGQ